MKQIINITRIHKCAFCKFWYDPTNSCISPNAPRQRMWNIHDINQTNRCLKRNLDMRAFASCPQYICKL